MFRNRKFLGGLALVVAFAIGAYTADGTIWTMTGNGSRRNTVEWVIESPTVGSAADLLPGADSTNSLGSSTLALLEAFIDTVTATDLAATDADLTTVTFSVTTDTSAAPTAAGIIGMGATPDFDLFVSTCTTVAGCWQAVGSQ